MKYLELKKEKIVMIETFENKNIACYGDNFQYVLNDMSTVEIPISFKRNMVESTVTASSLNDIKCQEYFGIKLSDLILLVEEEGFWWGYTSDQYQYKSAKEVESKTFNLENTYIFKIKI